MIPLSWKIARTKWYEIISPENGLTYESPKPNYNLCQGWGRLKTEKTWGTQCSLIEHKSGRNQIKFYQPAPSHAQLHGTDGAYEMNVSIQKAQLLLYNL